MVKVKRVLKADSSVEPYIHTKVLATLYHCFSDTGIHDITVSEQLSEVITYYVYQREETNVSVETVFSIIKAVLTETGYSDTAAALSEHRRKRCVKRHRLEVLQTEMKDFKEVCTKNSKIKRKPWSKSVIVEDLIVNENLDRQAARTIAGMVENKVFALSITKIPSSLVRQLVLNDAAAVLTARDNLQRV
jgi:hypothetical protein